MSVVLKKFSGILVRISAETIKVHAHESRFERFALQVKLMRMNAENLTSKAKC